MHFPWKSRGLTLTFSSQWSGELLRSLCRGMLGPPSFRAVRNIPAGLRVAGQQVLPASRWGLSARPAVGWLGALGGGSWHRLAVPPVSASLPREGPSGLPAPPSASGRPGLGRGAHFLHGGLQLSLKMTLVPLEVRWQKTKLHVCLRNVTRFLE